MMKKLSGLFLILLLFGCKSQQFSPKVPDFEPSHDRAGYIKNYKDLAILEMQRSGIPASITLAQALLESDNGNSRLAREANNHFGIKCHSDWKGDRIFHDDDKKGECFRVYKDVYKSYQDHSDFIANGRRYQFLFDLEPTDYKAWAKGLKKAGYATSRHYADLLIKIIDDNQLYRYDRGGSSYAAYGARETEKVLGDVDNFSISTQKHQIYNHNRIDYIIVKKGDRFNSLTRELEMLPWELYKYNELTEDSTLREGQILYIQPKRLKAAHGYNFHKVKEGETMYRIAQMYGIKLSRLYQLNLMEEGTEPVHGQKLNLRKKRKESFQTKQDTLKIKKDSL